MMGAQRGFAPSSNSGGNSNAMPDLGSLLGMMSAFAPFANPTQGGSSASAAASSSSSSSSTQVGGEGSSSSSGGPSASAPLNHGATGTPSLGSDSVIAEDDEEDESNPIHYNVACDGCSVKPLRGTRYKCSVCPDYDLCETCEASNTHTPDHALVKIRQPIYRPPHRGHHGHGHWRRHRHGHGHGPHGGPHGHHGHPPPPPHGFPPGPPSSSDMPSFPPGPPPPGFGLEGLGRMFGLHGGHHGKRRFGDAAAPPCVGVVPPSHTRADGRSDMCGSWRSEDARRPRAEFIKDLTIPHRTIVGPHENLIKTWQFQNTGSTQWPEGTRLVFLRGDRQLSMEEEFDVPRAQPGEVVEVSALLNTGGQFGRLTAYFKLADGNRDTFGPRVWADVIVASNPSDQQQQQQQSSSSSQQQQQSSASRTIVVDVDMTAAPSAPPQEPSQSASVPSGKAEAKEESPAEELPKVLPPLPAGLEELSSEEKLMKYSLQLQMLDSMGFGDTAYNAEVLHRVDGELPKAYNFLLSRLADV